MTTSTTPPDLDVDVAILGAGSGNSIWDAAFADRTGVLVDIGTGPRGSFGGTCLNVGCIPTKMYVIPADHARSPGEAARVGVDLEARLPVDIGPIRERILGRVDAIADAGRDYRASTENLTLLTEPAQFVDPHTLRIGGTTVRAKDIVVAVGSRPRWLDLPGFDDPALVGTSLVDSDHLVRMSELPRRAVVLGGGVESAEFGHILSAFGTDVTIVNRSETLLRAFDRDVAAEFTLRQAEAATLRLGETPVSARPAREDEDGAIVLTTRDRDGAEHELLTDLVLVSVGRVPNGDRLNLTAAGVEVDDAGYVVVDEHQRTTQPHIWALGDVSSHHQLKHVANMEARTVRHNLLHPDALQSAEHDVVPAAVFGHPQIAVVGRTEQELEESGTPYVVKIQRYADVAYGWAMEDEGNFVKVLGDPASGRVLGAHIIGPQASTLIQPLVQLMTFGQDTTEMVHRQYWIHPALSEVVENALLGMLAECDC